MKSVTLRQLRIFASAAKHQSFARAAQEIHVTQPAISMQIKELEENIGLPLFDRQGKNLALTVTGEYFLVYAKRMLATLKEAEDTIARFRGLDSGRVTIGMVSTATYFLPHLLARFRLEHPNVEFRLSVGNREQLVAQMQASDVDLSVMGRPPQEFVARAVPFAAHPLVMVTAVDHPFAKMESVPAQAFADQEFILREPGSGTRAALERWFNEHRIAPPVAMEMTSNETIKQAVMAGMGVSFLSLHTIGLELEQHLIAVPRVEGMPVMRRWQLVNLSARNLSPAAEAFRYFLLENGERFLAERFAPLMDLPATRESA